MKLGIDSDKYNPLIAIGVCVLVAGGAVTKYVLWRKKLRRNNGAESGGK